MRTGVITRPASILLPRAMLLGFTATLAFTAVAHAAPNTISFSNTIDPPTFVSDGSPADTDPDANEIETAFTLVDPAGKWTATGVILAATHPVDGATLVVTDTEIRNVTGQPIAAAIIEVEHFFDPLVSFSQQYIAHIDGAFDKIGGGELGNLSLDDSAFLNGPVLVDNFHFDVHHLDAPQAFDDTSAPLHLDTVNSQTERLIFYIDELDNVINLFDSATIGPVGPVGVESRSWSQVKAVFQ